MSNKLNGISLNIKDQLLLTFNIVGDNNMPMLSSYIVKGSNKANERFLDNLLTASKEQYSPNDLQVWIAATNMNTKIIGRGRRTEIDRKKIPLIINEAKQEIQMREKIISRKGVKNIQEYNQTEKKKNKLPYLIFILEDIQSMKDENTVKILNYILSFGRDLGLGAILFYPYEDIDKKIMSNSPGRITLLEDGNIILNLMYGIPEHSKIIKI